MPTVAELVAEHQRRYGHGEFERERYGVAEPDAVAALVDTFVREQLGVGVAGGILYAVSVGAVVGVELSDGRGHVVVKLQPESTSLAHLSAATEVQRALALGGFPAPLPLAGPVALGHGRTTRRGVPRRWWRGRRVPAGDPPHARGRPGGADRAWRTVLGTPRTRRGAVRARS